MTVSVEQIEPEVTRLRLRSWQGRLVGYEVSAYVVCGVLIDTGFAYVRRELLAAVEAIAPRGGIVTHWHEDHAGNAPALATRGFPLLMHADCETTLRARPPIRAYRHVVWGATPQLVAPLAPFDPAPLEVLHFPGHSSDHLAVWDAERRVLVSGDLFLGVKVRVAHETESPRRLLESLRRAAELQPRLLLDAHRGPTGDATSKLLAKAAWLEETMGEIEQLAARGMSERAIARQVLGWEDATAWASGGEYSRGSLVHAIVREQVRGT